MTFIHWTLVFVFAYGFDSPLEIEADPNNQVLRRILSAQENGSRRKLSASSAFESWSAVRWGDADGAISNYNPWTIEGTTYPVHENKFFTEDGARYNPSLSVAVPLAEESFDAVFSTMGAQAEGSSTDAFTFDNCQQMTADGSHHAECHEDLEQAGEAFQTADSMIQKSQELADQIFGSGETIVDMLTHSMLKSDEQDFLRDVMQQNVDVDSPENEILLARILQHRVLSVVDFFRYGLGFTEWPPIATFGIGFGCDLGAGFTGNIGMNLFGKIPTPGSWHTAISVAVTGEVGFIAGAEADCSGGGTYTVSWNTEPSEVGGFGVVISLDLTYYGGMSVDFAWAWDQEKRLLKLASISFSVNVGAAFGVSVKGSYTKVLFSKSSLPLDPGANPEKPANFCAKENEECQCEGFIQYGTGDSWYTTKDLVSGTTPCNNESFGDPAFGLQKICLCIENVYGVRGQFQKFPGAVCGAGYRPITTSSDYCLAAAKKMGYTGDAISHVDYEHPWGTDRPQGCFESHDGGRIHFNTGAGGASFGRDHIICERNAGELIYHGEGRCETNTMPAHTIPSGFVLEGKNVRYSQLTTLDHCRVLCSGMEWCNFFSWKQNDQRHDNKAQCYVSNDCKNRVSTDQYVTYAVRDNSLGKIVADWNHNLQDHGTYEYELFNDDEIALLRSATHDVHCDVEFYLQRESSHSVSEFTYLNLDTNKIETQTMRGGHQNFQRFRLESCTKMTCVHDFWLSSCPWDERNLILLSLKFQPRGHGSDAVWQDWKRNRFTWKGTFYYATKALLPMCPGKRQVIFTTELGHPGACTNSFDDIHGEICDTSGNDIVVCSEAAPICEGYIPFQRWGSCKTN